MDDKVKPYREYVETRRFRGESGQTVGIESELLYGDRDHKMIPDSIPCTGIVTVEYKPRDLILDDVYDDLYATPLTGLTNAFEGKDLEPEQIVDIVYGVLVTTLYPSEDLDRDPERHCPLVVDHHFGPSQDQYVSRGSML